MFETGDKTMCHVSVNYNNKWGTNFLGKRPSSRFGVRLSVVVRQVIQIRLG